MSKKVFNGQLERFGVVSKNSCTKAYTRIFLVPKIPLFPSLKTFLGKEQLERFGIVSKKIMLKKELKSSGWCR